MERRDRRRLSAGLVAAALLGSAVGGLGGRALAAALADAPTHIGPVTYCPQTNSTPGQDTLDVFVPNPAPPSPAPAVVFVHGGGWELGNDVLSPGGLFGPVSSALLADGFVVASVNYRLTDPTVDPPAQRFPDQIVDVKCAVRHLRQFASTYDIDPARIGAMGSSAGGHLVSLLGTTDASDGWDCGALSSEWCGQTSAVSAVVDEWGVGDFTPFGWNPTPNQIIQQVFGQATGERAPALERASPIPHLGAGAPPFLVVQGEEDPTNLPIQSVEFADRLRLAGVPVTVVLVHSSQHDAVRPVEQPGPAQLTAQMTGFLEAGLAGSAPPPGPPPAPPAVAEPEPALQQGSGWVTQKTLANLRGASCPTASRCWAVGSNEGAPVVLASADGGATWALQPLPAGAGYLHAVTCVSIVRCWTAGEADLGGSSSGVVFATADGGATWTAQLDTPPDQASFLDGVSCADASHCVVVGELRSPAGTAFTAAAYTTADGGGTWTPATSFPAGLSSLTGVACPTVTTCRATGTRLLDQTQVSYSAALVTSADGGATWSPRTIPAGIESLTGIACPSTAACTAIGYRVASGAARGVVLGTSDGGAHWAAATVPAGTGNLDGVSCVTAARCWAVGYSGVGSDATGQVIATNGGGTWSAQTPPAGTGYLDAVACAGASDCMAAGSTALGGPTGATVIGTSDGGSSWAQRFGQAARVLLESVACPTASTCWAVGEGPAAASILVTRTGGATWSGQAVPSGVTRLEAVACASASACLATGSRTALTNGRLVDTAVVVGTSDGGAHWTQRAIPAGPNHLDAVACADAAHCWAAGDRFTPSTGAAAAVILATADGGATWTAQSAPAGVTFLDGLSCPDAAHCWAVGEAGSGTGAVIVTADGGATWSRQTTPPSVSLAAISCPGVARCWAVGDAARGRGAILATADGGATWAAQTAPAGTGALLGVSCATATSCAAVGNGMTPADGYSVILALNGPGAAWVAQPSPTAVATLRGLTCTGPAACFAVGSGAIIAET